MVIGHHIILTGYGHWLPNDPRGSLSKELRSHKFEDLGDIHYGRKSNQPGRDELRAFYDEAKPRLNFPLIWFDSDQREAIAESFASVMRMRHYTCWACAVMPNHAHLLIRRHRDRADVMIERFRSESAESLQESSVFLQPHPIWSEDWYTRYVDTVERLLTVIDYIRENPVKSNLPRQCWGFVRDYAGEWSRVRRLRT